MDRLIKDGEPKRWRLYDPNDYMFPYDSYSTGDLLAMMMARHSGANYLDRLIKEAEMTRFKGRSIILRYLHTELARAEKWAKQHAAEIERRGKEKK